MYDSVTWQAIPADAEVVAGYRDGRLYAWPQAAWAAFPHAIGITVTGQTLDAQVGDVEWGDMTPFNAAEWQAAQRAAGIPEGVVYASLSRLEEVLTACGRTRLWSAHYTGVEHICSEACRVDAPNLPADFPWDLIVATQWIDHGPNGENYDISLCAEGWPR